MHLHSIPWLDKLLAFVERCQLAKLELSRKNFLCPQEDLTMATSFPWRDVFLELVADGDC